MRKKTIIMTTMNMTMIVVASLIRTMTILAAARDLAANKNNSYKKERVYLKMIGSYFCFKIMKVLLISQH